MASFPPVNPPEGSDVLVQLAPVNAAGLPTTGPFAFVMGGAGGSLVVATDTLSARFVTSPGDIDAVISWSDPRTGLSENVAVKRTAADNTTTAFNATVSVVPKLPA